MTDRSTVCVIHLPERVRMTDQLNLPSSDWLTDRLIDCPTDWLTEWLTDWLTDWPTDWLTDCPTDWLSDWLTDRLTDWPTDWLTDWLTDRLIDCSTDWLTDWLTGWNVLSLIFMLKPLVCKCDDADRQRGDTGSQSGDKPSNTGLLVDFLFFPNINCNRTKRRFVLGAEFLSAHFLFWEILNFRMPFSVYRKGTS